MENNQSCYVENIPDNFWYLRFLDKYMQGHKGFIAGGCFKNILSREQVKDIDIFFECYTDFEDAVNYFNVLIANEKDNWQFKYRNEKVCAFQQKGSKVWIELVESVFGEPDQILDKFDFTVTKFVYYKASTDINTEYRLLYHKDFFEHLHQKRLVIDKDIPFPISTWERTYRYKGYGYNMCRETKKKLLEAIRNTTTDDESLSFYLQGGWD